MGSVLDKPKYQSSYSVHDDGRNYNFNIHNYGTPEYIADRKQYCWENIKEVDYYLNDYNEKILNDYRECLDECDKYLVTNQELVKKIEELKQDSAIKERDQVLTFSSKESQTLAGVMEQCSILINEIEKHDPDFTDVEKCANAWENVKKDVQQLSDSVDEVIYYYNQRIVLHTDKLTEGLNRVYDRVAETNSHLIESGLGRIEELFPQFTPTGDMYRTVKEWYDKLKENQETFTEMKRLIQLEQEDMY